MSIIKSLFHKISTELQLAKKCFFSRVLLSNDKNICTHFPRSFLSVAQRLGAGVGAAVGPSQPSWLQIHLSEKYNFVKYLNRNTLDGLSQPFLCKECHY